MTCGEDVNSLGAGQGSAPDLLRGGFKILGLTYTLSYDTGDLECAEFEMISLYVYV